MTTLTLIQTIVVLGIVAVALVYVLRRVIKTTRGKCDCGCGCGSCPSRGSCGAPHDTSDRP